MLIRTDDQAREARAREAFFAQYTIRPEWAGRISVEQEEWLALVLSGRAIYVAEVPDIRDALEADSSPLFAVTGDEFSAAQIELRTDLVHFDVTAAFEELRGHRAALEKIVRARGLRLIPKGYLPGVVPKETSRRVPRYAVYAAAHPQRAEYMFRVAATQLHFGFESMEHGFLVLRAWHAHVKRQLSEWIDQRIVTRERMSAFNAICPNWLADDFPRSEDELWAYAKRRGFQGSPVEDYGFLRFHRQGSGEFRGLDSLPLERAEEVAEELIAVALQA